MPPGGYRGVGNVPVGGGSPFFVTPQMRLQLLENSVKLQDIERVSLGTLAKQHCPAACELANDGRETKIDIDALTPAAFLTLDVHVRRQLAVAAAASAARAPVH